MSRSFVLRIVLVTAGLLACNKSAAPAISTPDSTLAQVNAATITVDQFNQKWSQLPEAVRTAYAGPNGKKDFLGELITRELLLQKAHQLKLDQDKTFGEQVESYKERLLLDATLHELIEKKIQVSDTDLEAYFNTHRESLPLIEEARASHILVKTQAEARALLGRLRRGADFAALAKSRSIDPATKDKGGDLGVLRKGRVLPEFEKAVFELKPGQISDVVRTSYGYHIIRVQSRRSQKPLSVDDVRDEVREQIVKEKESALFDELVKTLRAESNIVISESRLASIGEDALRNHDPAPAAPH
ncbi:MAG TPA: peptidylprolyl isomerase [Nitrospiria bacterium]|nr:peptidylprolyl isomerase [Nitrospiria bacterium]